MKKTLLLILITSSFFSFTSAQSCPRQPDEGEKLCDSDAECSSRKCVFKSASCTSPTDLKVCEPGTEVSEEGSPISEQLCTDDSSCAVNQKCLRKNSGAIIIKVCTEYDFSGDIEECFGRGQGWRWDSAINECVFSRSSQVEGVGQVNGSSQSVSSVAYDAEACQLGYREGWRWNPNTNECKKESSGNSSTAGNNPLSGGAGTQSSGGTGGSGVTFSIGSSATTGAVDGKALLDLLKLIQTIMNNLAPMLIGIAMLAFFTFIVLFIWKGADNPTERDKMKHGILWSILAIFVMVSIWGLIGFIGSVTGIKQGGTMHGFKLPGQQ